jgi:hypothetical protein
VKRALVILAFSVLIFGLIISYDITQCDGQVIMRHFIHSDYEPVLDEAYEYEPVVSENTTDKGQDHFGDSKIEVKETEITGDIPEEPEVEEVIEDYTEEDASRGYEYYFDLLSDQEKNVYRAMYHAFENIESGNAIPTVDEEAMNRVANYIRMDHPEFFYATDLGYTHYTMGGQIVKTVLAVTYSDSKAAIRNQLAYIDDLSDQILSLIPAGADDYTKAKIIYEWIIENTDYRLDAPDNQSMTSVFYNHESVCAGYSRAYQYLLNKAGIDTTIVEGNSLVSGENHAWNLVHLTDGYYYVDCTWGDASYMKNGFSGEQVAGMNYDYLLVTTEEIKRTHSIALENNLPLCSSTENNYYVREGLLFMDYDYDAIKSVFDRAYSEGRQTVSFKCANLEVYDRIRRELISNNGIFDMLGEDASTISYVEDEEQRTLCFWL